MILSMGFWWCGCSNQNLPNETEHDTATVVIGENFALSDREVYLTTYASNAIVLDTAMLENGKLRFELPEDTEPFRACIGYRDSTGDMRIIRFVGANDVGFDNALDFFIVENGQTLISGVFTDHGSHVIAAIIDGYENQIVFRHGYDNLVEPDLSSYETYHRGVDSMVSLIKRYPSSYMLMERLYRNSAQYKKTDLNALFSVFDALAHQSAHAQNLLVYIGRCPDDYDPLQAIPLVNKAENYIGDYDRKKDLNMLIFSMAPVEHSSNLLFFYLRQQFESIGVQDLNVTEISVLGVKSIWDDYKAHEAPWDQLYVPHKMVNLVYNKYKLQDFGWDFPYVVFTDNTGNVVKRSSGFNRATSIMQYQMFIDNYLSRLD